MRIQKEINREETTCLEGPTINGLHFQERSKQPIQRTSCKLYIEFVLNTPWTISQGDKGKHFENKNPPDATDPGPSP